MAGIQNHGLAQEAINFTHTQHKKMQDRNLFGPKYNVFKAEVIHQNRVENLEKQIHKSRQHVVKHLLRARALQTKVFQTEVIERALKGHISNIQLKQGSDLKSRSFKFDHSLGDHKVTLSSITLSNIEVAAGLRMGHATMMQSSYNNYSDEKLCAELEFLPSKFQRSNNVDIFAKIVRAASQGQLSTDDAEKLCERAHECFHHQISEDPTAQWKFLVHMLRKKMMILYIAKSILKAIEDKKSATTLVRSAKGNVTMSKSNKSAPTINSQTKKMLRKDLSRSQDMAEIFSNEMIKHLSVISQSVPISVGSHGAAYDFAKRMGVRKMESVVFGVAKRTLREAWGRYLIPSNSDKYLFDFGVDCKMKGGIALWRWQRWRQLASLISSI